MSPPAIRAGGAMVWRPHGGPWRGRVHSTRLAFRTGQNDTIARRWLPEGVAQEPARGGGGALKRRIDGAEASLTKPLGRPAVRPAANPDCGLFTSCVGL